MKIFAIIFLLGAYSLSTFGVSLKGFYCCGKLSSVSVSLTNEGKDKCDKGNNEKGCCKTKYQFFKVKDNHFATAELTVPVKCSTEVISFNTIPSAIAFVSHKVETINSSNSPPLLQGIPLFIFNCAFRV